MHRPPNREGKGATAAIPAPRNGTDGRLRKLGLRTLRNGFNFPLQAAEIVISFALHRMNFHLVPRRGHRRQAVDPQSCQSGTQ